MASIYRGIATRHFSLHQITAFLGDAEQKLLAMEAKLATQLGAGSSTLPDLSNRVRELRLQCRELQATAAFPAAVAEPLMATGNLEKLLAGAPACLNHRERAGIELPGRPGPLCNECRLGFLPKDDGDA